MFRNKHKIIFSDTLKSLILILFLLAFTTLVAQDEINDRDIMSSYEKYTELPREIAFVHLNKSTFIKGEDIGFSTYVLDKESKQLSILTTNLYCVISDKNNKVIKKKLLKVENGISRDVFTIDSLFSSGEYTFKAYTNWMQNFKEQNFFVQPIRIIAPEEETFIKPEIVTINVDAQFLPEGGHLVADVQNVIGVVLKDSLGFGIPFAEGKLLNSLNEIITTFKVNKLGIGRFSFKPILTENYQVKINYFDRSFFFDIKDIEPRGMTFSLNRRSNNIVVSFRTNKETLPLLEKRYYKLAIHNGNALSITNVVFNGNLELIRFVDSKYLSPGVNIFTLFDDNNYPLLERLFFNHEGIEFITSDNLSVKNDLDSLQIKLSYQTINKNKFNNLSISVLPEETNSYHHHHNLPSYTLLQPYIKSAIEDAQYYFTEIDRKKMYELDNLLITQGWSSYNWNTIFNNPPNSYYAFENGIGFIANVTKTESKKFVLYPVGGKGLEYFVLAKDENSFQKAGLFPTNNDKIYISEMKVNGVLKPPSLFLQFFPAKIPDFNLDNIYLNIKEKSILNSVQTGSFSQSDLEEIQELEEVVVTAKVEQTRIEKIKTKTPFGRTDHFTDQTRGKNQTFADYLRQHGYLVDDFRGEFRVGTSDPRTLTAAPGDNYVMVSPTFYLDGTQVLDNNMLANYDMDLVDYIEINKSGIGHGIRGGGGVIKIFTLPISKRDMNNNVKTLKTYDILLTFSAPKKFYAPKYQNYNNDFFNKYGVIDWLPINKIDENGNYLLKIYNTKTRNIKLFIEGIANDGSFISEVKTIKL